MSSRRPVLLAGVGLAVITLFAVATCVPCDRRPPEKPTPIHDAAVDTPKPTVTPIPAPRDAEADTAPACSIRDAGDAGDAAMSKLPKRRQVCFDEDTPVRATVIFSRGPDC